MGISMGNDTPRPRIRYRRAFLEQRETQAELAITPAADCSRYMYITGREEVEERDLVFSDYQPLHPGPEASIINQDHHRLCPWRYRVGGIYYSAEYLDRILGIPHDHQIIDARWDFARDRLILKVIGPQMPIQREGEAITIYDLVYNLPPWCNDG